MCVTPSSNESLLRNRHIVPNTHVGLVVYPNALPNPAVVADLKLPGKFDTRPGAKDNAGADCCAKSSESAYPERGAYLPRVRYEEKLNDCPKVNNEGATVPSLPFTWRIAQTDYADLPTRIAIAMIVVERHEVSPNDLLPELRLLSQKGGTEI
jgi:hypothetical protein